MQRDDAATDLFGLAGTFPRPGWVVLDAARDHRFTGELRFDTSPPTSVYLDRGRIYLAERVTDPSLGARLVDAGALTAAQLERGAVRIGAVEHRTVEHLGHLFERVPNLDRHTVVVTADLLTEECVGWLASQRVPEVDWIPYRHHESGVHRWDRPMHRSDLAPGDPLPAPAVDEAPVSAVPPPSDHVTGVAHLLTDRHDGHDGHDDRQEPFLDGLIEWDEPSWLDGSELPDEPLEPRDGPPPAGRTDEARPAQDEPASPVETSSSEWTDRPDGSDEAPAADADWIDRLATDGLPDTDLLTAPKPLPRLPVEPVERFELVWPSGEIDDEFGAVDSVVGNGHDPDADRVGTTTRLGRPSGELAPELPTPAPVDGAAGAVDAPGGASSEDEATDEIVLAVRRAVASIEVGSLAARQRLADRHDAFGMTVTDDAVPAPGRVAVRSGRNDWSRRTVTRSVFDEPVVEPVTAPEPAPTADTHEHHERRVGALRRLIASLRR